MKIEKGIYKHYKGNVYEVIENALHSETLEEMVIYRDVSRPEKVWARPAKMWDEDVTTENGTVKRFSKLYT